MYKRTFKMLAAAGAIAVFAAACDSGDDRNDGDDAAVDDAAVADPPVGDETADEAVEVEPVGEALTLRMASPYNPQPARSPELFLGYTPAVADFIQQVEDVSSGNLSIELTYGVGELQPDFERRVIQAVAEGEMDVAWVGTRVFDTLGVTSFQALHAPLLVDSYALQAAIIDSDIPDQMLQGLDDVGVTGLAVLAGGLRKPIAVNGPLLGPDDWEGITFQFFPSDVQADTITALGGTPADVVENIVIERDAGLADGSIDAMENSLLTYAIRPQFDPAPYVTANVSLWPETTVLVVNPDRLAELTDAQAGWLREAAAEAATRSVGLHDVDADMLAAACERRSRFADASEADLAALRDAVAPVYAALEEDPQTQTFIEQIRDLKESVSPETLDIPEGCTGEAPSSPGPSRGSSRR